MLIDDYANQAIWLDWRVSKVQGTHVYNQYI
jgi:hypothetical protein